MATLSWQVLNIGVTVTSPPWALGLGVRGQGRSQDCGHGPFPGGEAAVKSKGREGGMLRPQAGSQGQWSRGACSHSPCKATLLDPLEQHGLEQLNSTDFCILGIYKNQNHKTEHCFLGWRPGEVTRDVLFLAGCLAVCMSVFGCCRYLFPSLPEVHAWPAFSSYTHA